MSTASGVNPNSAKRKKGERLEEAILLDIHVPKGKSEDLRGKCVSWYYR